MSRTLHSVEYRQLVAWLKSQREKRGISMRELAGRMDVTHSFVAKVEQQERRLDVVEFAYYCNALEVRPEDGLKAMARRG